MPIGTGTGETYDSPFEHTLSQFGQPDFVGKGGATGIVVNKQPQQDEQHIDRDHDVPLLAAALDGGKGFYGIAVDRRIPHAFTNQGVTYDPAQFVYAHEQSEHAEMETNGTKYQEAHDNVATPLEKQMVQDFAKSKGVDPDAFWKEHQKFWTDHLPQANAAAPEKVHPDTYLKPYEDSNHPHTNAMKEAIRNYDFEGREDEAVKAQGQFAQSTLGHIGEGISNLQGLLPGDPLGLANFIGPMGGMLGHRASSKTIGEAVAMERAGAKTPEIFKKTGWFRGSDGLWKYELPTTSMFLKGKSEAIPDKKSWSVADSNQKDVFKFSHGSDKGKFEDFFDYPELLEAYPNFKNMDIELVNSKDFLGRFTPGYKGNPPKILLNKNMDHDNTVVVAAHELQHAIQQEEGFPSKGSSPKWAHTEAIEQLRDKLKQTPPGEPEEKQIISLLLKLHADRLKHGNMGFSHYMYERNPGEIEANMVAARKLVGSQGIDPITHQKLLTKKGWLKPESWALEKFTPTRIEDPSPEMAYPKGGPPTSTSFKQVYSEGVINKITEDFKNGMTYQQIADKYNIPSRNSIAGILSRAGVKKGFKRMPSREGKEGREIDSGQKRQQPSLPRLKFLEKPFDIEDE